MAVLAGWSVSPPLWSKLKYLNNYWIDRHEIFPRMNPKYSDGLVFMPPS